MATDAKMMYILADLLPKNLRCSALVLSYGTARAARQTCKGWGLQTPQRAGRSINAGGGQLVSVANKGTRTSQKEPGFHFLLAK